MARMSRSVQEAIEAVGNAVKDDAVCEDIRGIGRLIADATRDAIKRV